MTDTLADSAINVNLALLEQGKRILDGIPSEIYSDPQPPVFPSSIGAHLRHVLDHYDSLLAGLPSGFIDYHTRQRDEKTETQSARAIERIESICSQLLSQRSSSTRSSRQLLLRVSNEDARGSIPTTIERELHFTISHTIHHYAMIAMMARQGGWGVPDDFGIAPSTLTHRRQLAHRQFQQSQATQ